MGEGRNYGDRAAVKITVFSSILWKTPEEAEGFRPELVRWVRELRRAIGECDKFLVSGTWSDPSLCPINVPVVNAGVEFTVPITFGLWDYAVCAGTAGFWYAFFKKDWDVLLYTDTTVLINCDLMGHLNRFLTSGKMIMAGNWVKIIDNGFAAYTRRGVVHYLHRRQKANLETRRDHEMLNEDEMTRIFPESEWLNPWPDVFTRVDHPWFKYTPEQEDRLMNLPVITKPTPRMVELHEERIRI